MSTQSSSSSPMNIEALYNEIRPELHRFAFGILKDNHLAEDAVQSAFSKYIQQEPEKVAGHERQWLFTVTRNTCFKMVSKQNRFCEFSEGEEDRIPDEAAAPDAVLSEEENFSELSNELKEALGKLSPLQREILNLRFFGNLSYKEIAEVVESTESSVGFLIHAAKGKLKRFMSFSH
jgi:RNA polymerase sigma-70 factor (ECF subfamily)